ncbi:MULTISPECIES: hypothetical protein [Pseudomonas]|uniref:hypothetical protein n=1 Tax=Pseudomonas TaxID=286 RepID=UPI003002E470
MSYLLIKIIHLCAAAFFIGGVFFEVMILSRASSQLPADARAQLGTALGARARKVMHWVVLALYGAGLALAWNYRAVLAHPFASSFSFLLSLKLLFALSILGHFIVVVWLMRTGRSTPKRSRIIHLSVLTQMICIVVLAKSMMFAW